MKLANRLIAAADQGTYTPTSYTTAYKFPSAATTTFTDAYSWVNTSNLYADDAAFADAPSATAGTWLQDTLTDRLVLSGFGFDTFTIPVGATILGIQAETEWADGYVPNPLEFYFRLHTSPILIGGVGSTKSFRDGSTTRTLGGAADTWSAGLTDSDIRDSGFGISLAASQVTFTDSPGQARVNYVKIRITYEI